MINSQEILEQAAEDLVTQLFQQQDFITLSRHALETRELEPAMALLRPILQQERESAWEKESSQFQVSYLEKHIKTIGAQLDLLAEKKMTCVKELLSLEAEEKKLDEVIQAPRQHVSRGENLEQVMAPLEEYQRALGRRLQITKDKEQKQIEIKQILVKVLKTTQLLSPVNSDYQTQYRAALAKERISYYIARCDDNERSLPGLSYSLFLDAIEKKLANTEGLTQTHNLTEMVKYLRLFLATEQEYNVLNRELNALNRAHQNQVVELTRQNTQISANQQDVLYYQNEIQRLNNLIATKTTELQESLSRQSYYQNSAIITAIAAAALLIMVMAVTLSIEIVILSMLAIPVLFLASLCLAALSLRAQDDRQEHQQTIQTATDSLSTSQHEIAQKTKQNDESSVRISSTSRQIAAQLLQIRDINSRGASLLEQIKQHKNQARFFSFVPIVRDSGETMDISYSAQRK